MRLTTNLNKERYVVLITDADRHTGTNLSLKLFDFFVGDSVLPCCCHRQPASLDIHDVQNTFYHSLPSTSL